MKLEFETLAALAKEPTLSQWYVDVIANELRSAEAADAAAAPNPYAPDLAKLRDASATDLSRFEDGWKADRLAALQAEYAKADLRAAERKPRVSAEELEQYAPPDPYVAGIKALQARDARALAAKKARR